MSTCCKAVIFDLDGTLLDTIKDLSVSMNYTLEKFGFPSLEISHHERAIGNGLKKYAKRCIPKEYVTEEFLNQFLQELAPYYRNHSTVKTVPYKDIPTLLDFLQENNILINVLSNKRDDFVKELVNFYFPDYKFICANGETPGIANKPDPEAALKIAEICNLKPSDFIFIGDSTFDVLTGKNAGMKTIGVTWGYQTEEMLKEEKPDFIAHNPLEIIEYIRNFS